MAQPHIKPTSGPRGSITFIFAALFAFPAISPAAERMETPVSFNVTPTGGASFSIPIEIPPGTAGMVPSISLSYSSQRGNGPLGMGGALGGLSAIYRCGRTHIQDNFKDTVNYNSNDKYCLDGQRLVAVTATASPPTGCTASTEYRTERESFTRVVSCGTAGSGPAYFIASTKAGQIIEFGNTTDSAVEAQGKADIRVWAVNKISDTVGNYLTVSYTGDGVSLRTPNAPNANGDYYPLRVDYTGNTATGLAPYNSVRFVYQTRTDNTSLYQAGSVIKTMLLLYKVRTYAKVGTTDTLVKDYRLGYDTSTATKRSRLTSIQECDGVTSTAICLPATTVGWQDATPGKFTVGAFYPSSSYNTSSKRWQSGDLNGDGKTDFVHMAGEDYTGPPLNGADTFQSIDAWISNGDGTFQIVNSSLAANSNASLGSWQSGDLDGDGETDFIHIVSGNSLYTWISKGDGTFQTGSFSPWAAYNIAAGSWRSGDLDGDGKTDLVHIAGGNYVNTWISNGDGTFQIGSFSPSASYTTGAGSWRSGDFNGDGKTDLVHIVGGNYVHTWISSGDGTFQVGSFSPSTSYNTSLGGWQSVDLNGDGKTDLVHIVGGTYVHTWISSGDGTFQIGIFSPGASYNTAAGSWQSGELNGDGKMDFVHIVADGNYVNTWISNGDGTFQVGNFSPSASYLTWQGSWQSGDIDGDGKLDLVHMVNGTYVHTWISSGSFPDLPTPLTTGLGTKTLLSYKPITDNSIYTKENTAVYPNLDLQAPLYVVASTTVPDGIGGTRSTSYAYKGAKIHLTGGGSLGFHQYDTTDLATLVKTSTVFRQDYPHQGLITSITQTQGNGSVLKNAVNTWSFTTYADTVLPVAPATFATTVGSKHHLPLVTTATEESYGLSGELTTRTTAVTEYNDGYGNATKITTSSNDGHSKVIDNTYNNDPVKWFLGRLTRSTVTSTAP